MTPRALDSPKTDTQRLEKKIDDLAAAVAGMHQEVSKIGRLEERIAAYMGIAERIEQASQHDVKDLNTKYGDHEARLRSLEATNAANAATAAAQNAAQSVRNRFTDSVVVRVILPVALFIMAFLAGDWNSRRTPQVTVTSAPVINPPHP